MSRPKVEEKAKSKSVSLLPSLWARIEREAGTHEGARSDYIRRLVEADLAKEGGTTEGVLTALARLHAPAAVETFRDHPVAGDRETQRWLLTYLLLGYGEAVEKYGHVMPVGGVTVIIHNPMREQFRAVAEPPAETEKGKGAGAQTSVIVPFAPPDDPRPSAPCIIL